MKLTPPFPLSTIDNPFGPSLGLNYQAIDGTIGHTGVDFNIPWGTPIPAAISDTCSVILSKNNPNLDAYRAVNTIYEDETGCYEIQYGHCDQIYASVGQNLALGETIGTIGNTGSVFQNGQSVTAAQKAEGSHAGSHLHFQVRVLQKVLEAESLAKGNTVHRLNDGNGNLVINGYCYEVPDFGNGYNGCVDPMPFFNDPTQVIKDEVQVLNQVTDPSVQQSFISLIIQQIRKLLGF